MTEDLKIDPLLFRNASRQKHKQSDMRDLWDSRLKALRPYEAWLFESISKRAKFVDVVRPANGRRSKAPGRKKSSPRFHFSTSVIQDSIGVEVNFLNSKKRAMVLLSSDRNGNWVRSENTRGWKGYDTTTLVVFSLPKYSCLALARIQSGGRREFYNFFAEQNATLTQDIIRANYEEDDKMSLDSCTHFVLGIVECANLTLETLMEEFLCGVRSAYTKMRFLDSGSR